MKARALLILVVSVAVFAPAQPAAAHGGSHTDLTANYRTRVTEVADVEGLTARAVGLDGSIEITWNGSGTLIVLGYENEPYLRFDNDGVAHNTRSPATYLNQDRYATAQVPAAANPDAPPNWQAVTAERRFQWHDHRTHWMSPVAPPTVQQDPNRSHVVYPRWEIRLTVDGSDAVVAGDLTWAPPPALLPWIGLAALTAIIAGLLLWSAAWRWAAVGLAIVGTSALTVDTIGFVTQSDDTVANRVWAFNYALAAAAATVRLLVHATRRTLHPTLAMMVAGLVLTMMGAVDRIDVLTSGFYLSALPITAARFTTVICLGTGLALSARFLRFLIGLFLARPGLAIPGADSSPTITSLND